MSLLAYNLTSSPVDLVVTVDLTVTLPPKTTGSSGPPVNVTSEFQTRGVDFTALEAQRPGVVSYAWTGIEEFDVDTLTVSSANNGNASIDARFDLDDSSVISLDGRVSDLESGTVSGIESIDALSLVSCDTSLTTRVSTEECTRSTLASTVTALSTASHDTSLTTRVSSIDALSLPSADASLTARVSSGEVSLAALSLVSHDTSLTTRVSTEECTRSSLASTVTALSTASHDTSLTTRLSDEEVARASIDSLVSSATASLKLSLDNRLSVASI